MLLSLSLTSCGVLEYVGNPTPDLKTIHFSITHSFECYTEEDKEVHPDEDCNGGIRYQCDGIADYDIDPELKQYLTNFVAIAKLQGIDLSYIYSQDITIKFTDYDNRNHVATAFKRDKPGIHIRVHRGRFNARTEQGKKYVMYHEFGHDILDLPHSDVGMMRATAYTGFFKPGRFSDERQNNYLYKSLKEMFEKYVAKMQNT